MAQLLNISQVVAEKSYHRKLKSIVLTKTCLQHCPLIMASKEDLKSMLPHFLTDESGLLCLKCLYK